MSAMDHRTLSPTSSFTSELPSEDISDFSDSEFDIISSSGSTKSHEREDAASVNNMGVGDDDGFQVATLEPFLFPDADCLGVPTSARTPNHGIIMPQGAAVLQPLECSAGTITEDDAIVMDALSQSLGRSTESIRAITPINGSLHNLHFVTSPKPTRRSSTNLVRAQHDASTPISSSTIQLEFPDPLSTSNESIEQVSAPMSQTHIQEAFVPDELPRQIEDIACTAVVSPTVEQAVVSFSDKPTGAMVEPTITTPEAAPSSSAVVPERVTGSSIDGRPAAFESRSIRPRARAIPSVGHVALVSNVILNAANALGRHWAASVVVSILALLIGTTTYIGTPATVTTKVSPSSPTSSLWTVVYPSNKSNLTPTHHVSQTAIGTMTDMSLSLVPSSSARIIIDSTMRGAKRILGSTKCESSEKVKPVEAIENSEAKLLIDGPFWGKGKWPVREVVSVSEASSSTHGSTKSRHGQLTLSDPKSIRATIANYLTLADSTAYSAVSEDIATLMRALDDLLISINTQTISFANAVYRTREEAAYRHNRAKSNAKKIRKQGREFLKGFKKSIAKQAKVGKMNAKEVSLLMKDVAGGVKEGISHSLKIKRSEARKQTGEKSVSELGRGCGRKSKRAQRAERVGRRKVYSEFSRTFVVFGRGVAE